MTVSLRYISGFVVALWVAAICSDALMTPPDAWVNGVQVNFGISKKLFLFIGATLAFSAALIIIKRSSYVINIVKRSASNLLAFMLCLLLVMLSILQANPLAVAYSILFFLTLVLTLYANQCLSENFYFAVSLALVCTLLALIVLYGPPNGRWIGGVHPNTVGSFALASVYFAARSRNSKRWVPYTIAATFAILISSRFAVVAIFIICLSDYLSRVRLTPSRLFLVTLVGFIGSFVLFTAWDSILNDILALGDPDRGLESGMTGRVGMWGNFWEQFVRRPFVGYGFRAREDYILTHNGFLTFLLENGVFAFCILVSLIYAAIYRTIHIYRSSRDPRQIIQIGFWAAWLLAGFLMPQLINFADTFALFTLFLLTDNVRDIKV